MFQDTKMSRLVRQELKSTEKKIKELRNGITSNPRAWKAKEPSSRGQKQPTEWRKCLECPQNKC